MQTEHKSTNRSFFLCLLPLVIYVGYCIGLLDGQSVTLDTISGQLREVFLHPLPFRVSALTGKSILICLMIWLAAFLRIIGDDRNLRPGEEYGTARFAAPEEVNQKLADPDAMKNKILSQNLRLSLDTRRTGLNNNVVVIGGSGAGKSFHYVIPNGYLGNTSLVITDPKGFTVQREQPKLPFVHRGIRVTHNAEMPLHSGVSPDARAFSLPDFREGGNTYGKSKGTIAVTDYSAV